MSLWETCRPFQKVGSLMLAFATVAMAGCTVRSAAGTSKSGDDARPMKVYIFNNSGAMSSATTTSNPQKLQQISKIIEDATNVEPVIIVPPANSDDATQKLNLLLSSGEQLDAFWGNWQSYSSKNMIVPINNSLSKYGKDIKKNISNDIFASVTDKNGKIWGIPRMTPTIAYPVWIRADWLKKLNISMPKTMDQMQSALQALKNADPAGNGSTMPMLTDIGSLRMCFAGAYTQYGDGNFKDKDNKIKPVQLAAGYKDFLSKMHDWYSMGLISKETFTYKTTQITDLIKQNKVASTALWYSRVTLNQGILNQNVPDADYEIANLTGPEGKAQTVDPAGNTGLLISSKSKNVDAVIKLMNWYNSDVEHYIIGAAGIEGVDWKYTDEKTHTFTLLNPGSTDYQYELNLGLGLYNENQAFANDATKVKHATYLKSTILDLSLAKKPYDFGITYDQTAINTAVPNYADITRMMDEQEVKFITGARSLSEFNQYLAELNKAGLDKYITEINRQYDQLKK